ncbi:hypothetical protein C465_04319 [Halorubrum distributum JCM 9100]|uniref:ParB/Sulfiredoxin domain-containing protein n=1 Tax=Halorubrum distributum JCM 9100 TaxID=1227467 RepID=M0ETZ3_9EURY|nr:hypothetical protein C465_04319 [Halorubrum distributum JCM 9100]
MSLFVEMYNFAHNIIKQTILPWGRYAYNWWQYGPGIARPGELINVDPREIEYVMIDCKFNHRAKKTHAYIKGGDWDRNYLDDGLMFVGSDEGFDELGLVPVEDYGFYTSLRNHFEKGLPWEETEIYKHFSDNPRPPDRTYPLTRDDRPHRGGKYATKDVLDEEFSRIDDLYEHMKEYGYLTQRELREREDAPYSAKNVAPASDEVLVNIGRSGNIIFDEGRHRFAVARILGLESIPVKVLVRHENWQAIRREVARTDSTAELSDRSRRYLDHPDIRPLV